MEKLEADNTGILVQVAAVCSIAFLCVLHIIRPDSMQYGLYEGCAWWHRVTFHFFHAGFFHMLLNWWFLVTASFMYRYKVIDIIVLLAGVSVYPFANEISIVGLSGLIYAMAGVASVNFANKYYVISIMLLTIVLTGLIPHVAFLIHLWSYCVGLVYGITKIYACRHSRQKIY